MGAQLVLTNLATLPSGLKFQTLKFSGCVGNGPQLLVDAHTRTLGCMEFTRDLFGTSSLSRRGCPKLMGFACRAAHPVLGSASPVFRKLETKLANQRMNTEGTAEWSSSTLSIITSSVFAELTICIPRVYSANESGVRGLNSVDDALDQLNPREDATLVAKPLCWSPLVDEFEYLIRKCFPLMWKGGRVVLETPPPDIRPGG